MTDILPQNTLIKFLYKDKDKYVSWHKFEYKLGENINTEKFYPFGNCEKGGLYYTNLRHGHGFVDYGNYVAIIEIPQGAKTYDEPCGAKFKADKLFVKKIMPMSEFIDL